MHLIHGASVLSGTLLLKDMTSFVTDFETHVIWQGYIEDPAAKDFVARKARTIALNKAQGSCHKTSNNQPIHEFGYPFGDSIPRLY